MNGPCTRTRNSKPIGGTISRENVSLTDAFSLVFLMTVGGHHACEAIELETDKSAGKDLVGCQ